MNTLRVVVGCLLSFWTINAAAQVSNTSTFVEVAAVEQKGDADRLLAALQRKGLAVKEYPDAENHLVHLKLGPYTRVKAESVRKTLLNEGYAAQLEPAASTSAGATEDQAVNVVDRSVEPDTEDHPKAGDRLTTAQAQLEAQAFENLGVSGSAAPSAGADLEDQALRAMRATTAQNEIDDADQRVRNEALRTQQAELAASRQQANSQPTASSTGGVLAGLTTVLQGVNDGLAQQSAQPNQIQQSMEQAMARNRAIYENRTQPVPIVATASGVPAAQAGTPAGTSSGTGNGLCPNGKFVDDAARCDCRTYSANALYSCPTGKGASAEPNTFPQGGAQHPDSNIHASVTPPKDSSRVSNRTVGDASVPSCAVTPSGSQMPLTPETTASTCNPAACRDASLMVTVDSHWFTPGDPEHEVVGFFTNGTLGTLTCTFAFEKGMKWVEYGNIYLKEGEKSKGGQFGGVWTMGATSDKIRYQCFEGKDPVDIHGRSCNAPLRFSWP